MAVQYTVIGADGNYNENVIYILSYLVLAFILLYFRKFAINERKKKEVFEKTDFCKTLCSAYHF